MTPSIIPLSKAKLIKLFIFSIIFIVMCSLFIATPFWFIKSNNPFVIKLTGYVGLIFFGVLAFVIGKKLFNKKPGLVIDENGILDNSSGVSVGKVLWTDISGIREKIVSGQKFLMIDVKNPNVYIDRENNPLKKRILDVNLRLYQTPINITSNGLKIEYDDLRQLIEKYFAQHKQ